MHRLPDQAILGKITYRADRKRERSDILARASASHSSKRCSSVCAGAPLWIEANGASGSDVVSNSRFESTNSSRSVRPESIFLTIFGSAPVPPKQALGRREV